MINGALRIGIYPTIKDALPFEGDGLAVKLCAGLIAGGLGASIGNPTDIVKIRFQTESGLIVYGRYTTGLYQGSKPTFPHTGAALVGVFRQGEFFRGVGPSILRASLLTSGQVASYQHTKEVLAPTVGQGPLLFIFAGAVSGLAATTFSAPADLIKTRVMGDRAGMIMVNQGDRALFTHGLDCLGRTFSAEGMRGLYKGWLASYMRIGPHFIISWPLLEFVRTRVFGLEYF